MPYHSVVKRWLVKIAVLLALGAIVNIAVGWGCTLWSRLGGAPDMDDEEILTVWHRGRERLADCFNDITWPDKTMAFGYSYRTIAGRCTCQPEIMSVLETTSGWPIDALRGQYIRQVSKGDYSIGLIVRSRVVAALRRDVFRCLPMAPVWPGFVINTIFYALILWTFFAAPFELRRWRRIKRGLCPACAYPVGSNEVCTECGKRVKGAST